MICFANLALNYCICKNKLFEFSRKAIPSEVFLFSVHCERMPTKSDKHKSDKSVLCKEITGEQNQIQENVDFQVDFRESSFLLWRLPHLLKWLRRSQNNRIILRVFQSDTGQSNSNRTYLPKTLQALFQV